MPLALVLGPANCGKIGLLQERFLAFVDAGCGSVSRRTERPDVEAFEREVLLRRGALVGGRVGTFDALFDDVLERCGEHTATPHRRAAKLILQRVAGGRRARRRRRLGPVLGLRRRRLRACPTSSPLAWSSREPRQRQRGRAVRPRPRLPGRVRAAGPRPRPAGPPAPGRRSCSSSGSRRGTTRPVLAYGFEDMTTAQVRALLALAAPRAGDRVAALRGRPARLRRGVARWSRR